MSLTTIEAALAGPAKATAAVAANRIFLSTSFSPLDRLIGVNPLRTERKQGWCQVEQATFFRRCRAFCSDNLLTSVNFFDSQRRSWLSQIGRASCGEKVCQYV